MKRFFSKPLNTFLTLFILLFLIFLLFPINIFDGEIIYNQGLVTMAEKRPLSLYFVSGLEYSKNELKGIQEFHLLHMQWTKLHLMQRQEAQSPYEDVGVVLPHLRWVYRGGIF